MLAPFVKQAVFNALVQSFLNSIESSVFKTCNNVELHRAWKLHKHNKTRTHIPSRRCNLSFRSQYFTFRHRIAGHLFAFYKVRKLLFRYVAVTDLCVGLIKQPLCAAILLQAVTRINLNIFRIRLAKVSNGCIWQAQHKLFRSCYLVKP